MGRACLVSWMMLGVGVIALGCSASEVPVGVRNALENQGGAAGSGGSSTVGGAGSGGSTASTTSSGSGGSTSQPAEAGNDGGDPRVLAATYARDDIACAVDSDCCLVTDRCKDAALVVGAADKDAVTNLIRSADMKQCLGCIAPFVQVSCTQGKCLGTSIDIILPDAGDPDPRLAQDHCGTVDRPITPRRVGSKFGCGG